VQQNGNKDNNMPLDVDACIESLKGGEIVPESSLKILCQYVSELLMEESNVQPVLSPVTIVGDLHGQVFDLLNLLNVGGWPPTTSYIFLVRTTQQLALQTDSRSFSWSLISQLFVLYVCVSLSIVGRLCRPWPQ
jgi:hypothetical protein